MSDETATPLVDLGRRLREARTKRGWTILQASERTRITVKHLQALESGDVTGMPAPVYIRGFVRGYAKALDLSESEMLAPLDEAGIRSSTVPLPSGQAPEPESGWRPTPRTLGVAAGVVAFGILFGLGVRGFVRFMGSGGDATVPPSPFETPARGTAPARHAAPAEEREAGLAQSGTPAPGSKMLVDHVDLSVTATQECWVEWQVDARRAGNEILKAGTARMFRGETRVRLLIGNPAGLDVTGPFGRVPLPRKAPRGIHLLFTRQGVQPLEVPAPSATMSGDPATRP